MDKFNNIFDAVFDAMKREFGDDVTLEEGETLVFQLNDCVLIMSREDGHFRTEFVGGEVIPVDITTGFYIEEE